MDKQQKEYVINEYVKGKKSLQQIACDLGVTFGAVKSYVKIAKKNGVLSSDRKKRVCNKMSGPMEPMKKPTKFTGVSVLQPGQSVNCTKSVAKTCIYGCSTDHSGLCNYMVITGRARILVAPNPKKCTAYMRKK